jgi:fumarate reductase flavoprotein subunit
MAFPMIRPSAESRATAKADVVVVGAGACGLTAGLAARKAGAEVFVLERDATPHGNTSLSQGTLAAAGTRSQALNGIEDSGERFYQDIMIQSARLAPRKVARVVADQSGPTIDWLVEHHGIPLVNNPDWHGFGHSRPRLHVTPTRTGAELHGSLLNALAAAGGELVTGAHVVDLFAGAGGRVTGVRIGRPDGSHEDLNCDALVLANGGFGANRQMVSQYAPSMGEARYSGWETIQGEGILWGAALGAAMGDLGSVQNFGTLTDPSGIPFNPEAFVGGAMQVALDGRRFSNEVEDISGQGDRVARLPDQATWVLFDGRIEASLRHLPEHQQVLSVGAMKTAQSVDELAAATGLPREALRRTLAEAGSLAGTNLPDAFGRRLPAGSRLEAPFHAVKATCALFHTLGGLVVDDRAQVLKADATRLPNLFAAGGVVRNLAGPTSSGYLPGSGLSLAITLGRVAGAAAVKAIAAPLKV